MNLTKKRINTGIFALILLLLSVSWPAYTQEFVSKRFKFSLTYDSSLEPAEVKVHNVALALKSKTSGFPTFNVVIESGKIDLKAPLAEKEKAILDSYKLVGINDVSIISSYEGEINGRTVYKSELKYSLNNVILISYVALFSSNDRRYILTFIDSEEGYKISKSKADDIFASFQMIETPLEEPQEGFSFKYLLKARIIIPSLIILVVIVITLNFLHTNDQDLE